MIDRPERRGPPRRQLDRALLELYDEFDVLRHLIDDYHKLLDESRLEVDIMSKRLIGIQGHLSTLGTKITALADRCEALELRFAQLNATDIHIEDNE